MKEIELTYYQKDAIEAIQEALNCGRKHIVVEMPIGCGKSIVLAKTLEIINNITTEKILVVTNTTDKKLQIKHILSENHMVFSQIEIENLQKILKFSNEKISEYQFLVFYDVVITQITYDAFECEKKTAILFTSNDTLTSDKFFKPKDIVFTYSFKEAVNDGIITPAMDPKALGPAVEVFSKQLLEQFGFTQDISQSSMSGDPWDLHLQNHNRKIWVICKIYKNQLVSPATANSLLMDIIMRKRKQSIPKTDIILLIVFSRIPSFQKDVIYERYGIVVWDIENLVFYCKRSSSLLKQLSQITYFPIDYIEGQESEEAISAELSLLLNENEIVSEAEKEIDKINELIQRLKCCKSGNQHSREYETVCEEIIRILFESRYFNILTSQHRTKDEHFRMDLIGSLKVNQNNDKNMHPLWQLLIQHYNSHFIVFEFKNYSKAIDQNLIYITEKYLFDAALRNVAIIISRKGFSKSAEFAAQGCLKEHGKLIIDLTDEDLIKMLEVRSDEATDFILQKLEKFLMSISK
ncbi:DEAD/DEAH box helicase family protein [Lachnospiraceae bacterium HCP1S3_A8]